MQKMVERFGKLTVASFIIMGVGLVAFLSTPIWLQFGIDTDMPGFFTLIAGVALFFIGLIRRKKLSRVKLVVLIVLVSILSLSILCLMLCFISYFITG